MESILLKKFGSWTVLSVSEKPYHYKCQCVCGFVKDVYYYNLVNKQTTQCVNCLKKNGTSRKTIKISCFGKELTREEWAKELNISYRILCKRLSELPLEEALTSAPKHRHRKDLTCFGITMSKTEWAKRLGISRSALYKRLEKFPLEEALKE